MIEEDIRKLILSEKLTNVESKKEDADRAIAVESAQECAVRKNEGGSLNTGNRDVVGDNINRAVDTRKIILSVKADLLVE